MNEEPTIGERIARLRGEMTQTELATRVKRITGESLSRAAIAQWEGGAVKNLRPENLLAVCEVFSVDPWTLVFGERRKKAAAVKSAMTDTIEVSDAEREILVLFRTLPPDTQTALRERVKQLADIHSDARAATKAALGITDQASAEKVEAFGAKPRTVKSQGKTKA